MTQLSMLYTKLKNGYELIQDNTQDVVIKTRRFKEVSKNDPTHLKRAEKRLAFTTLKN